MPGVQSTTPDIFIKAEQANAEIVDDRSDLPSYAAGGTAQMELKLRGSNSASTLAGGTISGTVITMETSTVGLAVGLYDAEWIIIGGGAETTRVPPGTFLLVEVVEPLS